MSKNFLWLVVSGLMTLSLVMAACGPAAVEEKKPAPVAEEKKPAPIVEEKKQVVAGKEAVKPAAEAPKYGGTLNLVLDTDASGTALFDSSYSTAGASRAVNLTNQSLWQGNWAKGPAGGYGTSETDWGLSYDVFAHKEPYLAESAKWTADLAKDEGTIVYQIRQGIHWALNPASEASRLVNGRELTADDVVFELNRAATNPKAYFYRAIPELKAAKVTKTGPWEVTVKLPLAALMQGVSRFGDSVNLHPPEVITKYGDASNWRNSVGTGPFILTDVVSGSAQTFIRNDNFWMKDPIGPGKGNQLPYLNGVRLLIIPDASTRLAALRTAKIDVNDQKISWEDAIQMKKTTPALLQYETLTSTWWDVGMRMDRPPFNDIRVRRALFMATDFEAILQSVYGGRGQILTWPQIYTKTNAALYLGLDDPEMPASVKELYSYNTEKARQLLKEAGYPNGFKTEALVSPAQVDQFSIYKDMWAKVGIDLTLVVREMTAVVSLYLSRDYVAMTRGGPGTVGQFYALPALTPRATTNTSIIDDVIINKAMEEMRRVVVTDELAAMKLHKELMKYLLDQAYELPSGRGYASILWWPWVKNYSGEFDVGYFNFIQWSQWVWLDQALKKSMGY